MSTEGMVYNPFIGDESFLQTNGGWRAFLLSHHRAVELLFEVYEEDGLPENIRDAVGVVAEHLQGRIKQCKEIRQRVEQS